MVGLATFAVVVEVVDEMVDDMAAAFRKMAALPMVVAPRDFYL